MGVTAALLLIVVQQAAATLLLVAGRRHRRHRTALLLRLRGHRVLPAGLAGPVSRLLPAGSTAAGALILALPVATAPLAPYRWVVAGRLAAAILAVVYLSFLIYLYALLRRAPDADCGCLGTAGERPVPSLVRAAVVVAASLVALAAPVLPTLSGVPGFPVLVLLATALGTATAVAAAGIHHDAEGVLT